MRVAGPHRGCARVVRRHPESCAGRCGDVCRSRHDLRDDQEGGSRAERSEPGHRTGLHGSVGVLHALATIYLEGGAYQKSLDYFDQALTLNPDQPFVYFNRARAYETLGDINASIADLERCLTYNPDDALSAKITERVAQLRARL
ncbi:tetratricopeptide repeat protein [Burkholderia metallica]|nr:tetratricopeptide repeat protein [Burkholderia metallica]